MKRDERITKKIAKARLLYDSPSFLVSPACSPINQKNRIFPHQTHPRNSARNLSGGTKDEEEEEKKDEEKPVEQRFSRSREPLTASHSRTFTLSRGSLAKAAYRREGEMARRRRACATERWESVWNCSNISQNSLQKWFLQLRNYFFFKKMQGIKKSP